MVYGDRGFGWQCNNKPVVTRDDKLYCRIHDPEYIKEKNTRQQAKWDKESAERHCCWELESARKQATEGLTLAELKKVTPDLIRRALKEL